MQQESLLLILFNFSLSKFKEQVHLFTAISPENQILLIGPPYKKLDSASLLSLVNQRIFVYNRGVLSKQLPKEPTLIVLPPFEILEPQAISTGRRNVTIYKCTVNSTIS